MEKIVLQYAPDYWDKTETSPSTFVVKPSEENSSQFANIALEIKSALLNKTPLTIERNQNIFDYGQVLIREQLLSVVNPVTTYYRVRRFIKIESHYRKMALKYNLDHRRCGLSSLTFQQHISDISAGNIVLVVQVITNNPNVDYLTPESSSDYFIDYILTF